MENQADILNWNYLIASLYSGLRLKIMALGLRTKINLIFLTVFTVSMRAALKKSISGLGFALQKKL
jgi:hypothetical protein